MVGLHSQLAPGTERGASPAVVVVRRAARGRPSWTASCRRPSPRSHC